jgi:stearoyl-CoA desaturase (delta-9 desaturase)
LAIILGYVDLNFWIIFVSWFLIGPVGIGVGFHRLFSHRQFETWRPVEIALAILGTLSTYSPILFWVGNHQTHHKLADSDKDIQSPAHHSLWESFTMWRLRSGVEKTVSVRDYCTRRCLRDPALMLINKYTVPIIWGWAIFLLIISPNVLVSIFVIPSLLEHIRINLINYVSHKSNFLFNYRNIDSDDSSQNNLLLGWLGFGIGWHNNHHANERELINTRRWWEIDLEGQIGKILTKNDSSYILRKKTQTNL